MQRADRGAQFARDRPGMLDREVGDAAARIELVRRREGLGRAGIEAGPARAAMIGFCCIRDQHRVSQHHAQEEPGAEFAADQVRMLALPAQTGLGRQRLFHQRRGIDEDFHLGARLRHEGAGKLLQPRFQQVVIVPPPRIDRDIAETAFGQHLHRVEARPVVQGDNDGRFRAGPHGRRRLSAFKRRRHPVHLAVTAFCHERLEPLTRRPGLVRTRDAHAVKPDRARSLFEEGFRRGAASHSTSPK